MRLWYVDGWRWGAQNEVPGSLSSSLLGCHCVFAQRQIQDRDEEVIEIEKQYESLQEAAADKTKKLKKVWGLFRSYTAEIEDLNQVRWEQLGSLNKGWGV